MAAGPESAPCAHCGAPVRVAADSDGPHYCCAGCEAVASLLSENGWERFYEERDGWSPRPTDMPTEAFDGDAYQDEWVTRHADGTLEGRFRVGGIQCAACVWLTERVLSEHDGVADAHVSYGTGMATVRWNPESTRLSELAETVARLGYTPSEPRLGHHTDRAELVRLGIAAFCAMNVMFIHVAIYLGEASGDMAQRHAALFAWASLILATPAVFVSSVPFFRGSWTALRAGMLSMDVPVAVAIAVMYVHGFVATFVGEPAYLDSLTMLVAFLLAGRVVVSHGRGRAAEAAEAVLATAPQTANRREDEAVVEVPVAALRIGDIVVAGAGQRLGADGVVTAGSAFVDLSHVTGEARPVEVEVGQDVPAGAGVVSGQIDIRVSRPSDASTVARIGQLVRAALEERSPARELADRLAPWFTGAVLLVAAGTFIGWTLATDAAQALRVVVAVLVVACPCALALAAPTTLAVGIGAAARRGAFVRSGHALLELATIERVAFDKTGTLTEGAPRVTAADDETLALAGALELGHRHPVARAIVAELGRRDVPLHRATDVAELDGGGVTGRVDGREVRVAPAGPGAVRVTVDGEDTGSIEFADCVREDAARTVASLRVPVSVLSGDHPDVVARVAREVGIDEAAGGMRPEDKTAWIGARQNDARILFAGDGINDAPALATATVGVAMGEGADAAVRTADVVVLDRALAPVAAAMAAGRVAARVLRQNARFAVTYNVSAVVLAASGNVTPLIAALLMPLSSLIVIGNALSVERRVRKELVRTDPPTPTPEEDVELALSPARA